MIGFDGGDTNLYGYVFQDPINYIDNNVNFAILLIIPLIPAITSAAIATAKFTAAALAAYAYSSLLKLPFVDRKLMANSEIYSVKFSDSY